MGVTFQSSHGPFTQPPTENHLHTGRGDTQPVTSHQDRQPQPVDPTHHVDKGPAASPDQPGAPRDRLVPRKGLSLATPPALVSWVCPTCENSSHWIHQPIHFPGSISHLSINDSKIKARPERGWGAGRGQGTWQGWEGLGVGRGRGAPEYLRRLTTRTESSTPQLHKDPPRRAGIGSPSVTPGQCAVHPHHVRGPEAVAQHLGGQRALSGHPTSIPSPSPPVPGPRQHEH